MRQVVLDTETTGLEVELGHRILEIGCVEIIDRKLTKRKLHQYVNPQRESDDGALEVHGITSEFLADKPLFADIFDSFLDFVKGALEVGSNSVNFVDETNSWDVVFIGLTPDRFALRFDTFDCAENDDCTIKNSE